MNMNIDINSKNSKNKKIFEIFIDDIYEWDDFCEPYDCHITAQIKFGEYCQDGSGGEYGPELCYGLYFKIINIEFNVDEDYYNDDKDLYYPYFKKQRSILSVFNDSSCDIDNLKLISKGNYDIKIIKRGDLKHEI